MVLFQLQSLIKFEFNQWFKIKEYQFKMKQYHKELFLFTSKLEGYRTSNQRHLYISLLIII